MTYRIYLKRENSSSQLFLLNPKANEIPLDTIFFRNDSLLFKRGDFFSTFAGQYHTRTNTIHGYWTDDAHKKHVMDFYPVDPDTLTGIRPRKERHFQWQHPLDRNDGLSSCSLPDQNINRALVDSLSYHIMTETYPNIHSLLISRNGCLVYEEYFYGWKANNLWLIQSATKSFTSALTGIALANGEIKNLDEPICGYLTKYEDKACNQQNKDITIRRLLTMTTGLDWNELEFDYYDKRNTNHACWHARDPFDCVLSRNKITTSDPVFSYNSMNHLMVNKILRKATGIENKKELTQRLLKPLGIKQVNTGDKTFGTIGDIALTPRDMHKFGILFMNNGSWNDKQIVPASWVKESTAAKIEVGPSEGYGYFWWTKQFNVNEKPVDCFYAWGYGGQYIFIVPSKNLVVTMTASNWVMNEKKYAFEMMEKYIILACKN
jgi:hypothetical protein